jgi:hypothetical protein
MVLSHKPWDRRPSDASTDCYHGWSTSTRKALIPDTHTAGLWLGRHRTFRVDGSSFSMPDTPELQAQFGQPGNQKPGCGFPVASILVMFHAGTGLLLGALAAPLRTHEMAHIEFLHTILQLGDVLVADRGFCSFAHLALLVSRGAHAVIRMHQRQIVDFTPERPYARPKDKTARNGLPRSRWLRKKLGVTDQLVEWFKPDGTDLGFGSVFDHLVSSARVSCSEPTDGTV